MKIVRINRSRLCLVLAILLAGRFGSNALGGSVAGPEYGVDDYNTSVIAPLTAISTLPNAQANLITQGLNAFDTANSTATSVWTYSWAGQQQEADVEAGINVTQYNPFVVNIPDVTAGDNSVYAGNNTDRDLGGAVLNMTYSLTQSVQTSDFGHVFNNLHWIQALSSYYDSGPNRVTIDNPFATGTPYYDDGGAAGKGTSTDGDEEAYAVDSNSTAWFLDRPFKVESESAETNPVANLLFQVVLADETDSYDSETGVTTHAITLYGGEQWGYTYVAGDLAPVPVPLPTAAGIGFVMLGGFGGLMAFRRRSCGRARIA